MNLLYFTILFGFGITVTYSKKCTEIQTCIPIDQCDHINNQLKQKLSPQEQENLRNLQCGFYNSTVYVCCDPPLPRPDKNECGCVVGDTRDKITNGHEAEIGEFPYIALLGRRWKEGNKTGLAYECGGSLINKRYVLTAAHCVKFIDEDNFKEYIKTIETVRLGEYNKTSEPNDTNRNETDQQTELEVEVEKIIPHPNYRLSHKYDDIALLRLKDEVNFTEYIQPICLPSGDESLDTSPGLTIMGWGTTGNMTIDLNGVDILRMAVVQLVDHEKCNEQYSRYEIRSTQLCAGNNGKDSCQGDSGGPAVATHAKYDDRGLGTSYNYQVGIVSFGRECGTKFPGIYTDVRKYLDWIKQHVTN